MTYGIMRRVLEADRFVRAGRWQTERVAASHHVAGQTTGPPASAGSADAPRCSPKASA